MTSFRSQGKTCAARKSKPMIFCEKPTAEIKCTIHGSIKLSDYVAYYENNGLLCV